MQEKQIIDVADLDCIFLTYQEPKREEFWLKIQNMVPWAKRVDGVQGSDAAHKAAADASETARFILVDGDNIPDPSFFNEQLVLDADSRNKVFRWKARNVINGLIYGNGGISCWTKEFVRDMRTHESSAGDDATKVEFCFDPNYWAMHDCYSTTYPNGSPAQAWQAGFREGVKLCLDRGAKPALSEFEKRVHARNYDNLSVWHNIGYDADYGIWAIYGARVGTHLTMLTDWDYTEVQDFSKLAELWKQYGSGDPTSKAQEIGTLLSSRLGLLMLPMYYNGAYSQFFKHHYRVNFVNKGIMTRE